MTKFPLRRAGFAAAGFALALNVPYTLLIQHFGYDAILREPPAVVLAAFHAGGVPLILMWLAFALCALAFLPVSALIGDGVRATGGTWSGLAVALGAGAALSQAIGLGRWVFVVPVLADIAVDPAASEAMKAAAVVSYQTLHQFAGVGIGEHLGQTLSAGWTIALSRALLQGGIGPRWLGWVGMVIAALWIVGQATLLATVGVRLPIPHVTPAAFMAWEAWLLVLAVVWIRLQAR